jgi:hypothetical protein
MQIQLGLVLARALIAGVLGWRSTRKRWRSLYDETPGGMSDRTFFRLEKRRYMRRRIAKAVVYAVIGAVIGWAISLYLHLS